MKSKSEKIVITGATGMVGSHLAAELLRQGYDNITVPVRGSASVRKLRHTLFRERLDGEFGKITIAETPLDNINLVSRAFEGATTVFHCAAQVSLAGSGSGIVRCNVDLTANAVNAAIRAGAEKFVYVSSIAALCQPGGGKPADESCAMESLGDALPYAASKYLSGKEVSRGAKTGMKTVTVYPSVVIGAGEWGAGSSAIVPLLARGLPVYPAGVSGFVDVKDVARAMVLLAENEDGESGHYIISGGDIPLRELMTWGAEAAGRRAPRYGLGKRAITAIGWADLLLSSLRGRARSIDGEMARILSGNNLYRGDKIERELGFEYTPLKEAVERVVKQYLQEKNG